MRLDTNKHSVYSLHYHLILVTKYRKKVFDDNISQRAKEIFSYIGRNYGIDVIERNHDQDHIHVLFKAQPKSELSKFINAYKSASSRLLKKEYPHIKNKLWKSAFWSRSFCLMATGNVSIETIKQYITTQGVNNK